MMIRPMLEILALLAVLLMPLGMGPAAAEPMDHQMATGMPMGHCPDQAPSHDQKGGIADCTMACAAALTVVEGPDAPAPAMPAEQPRLAAAQQLHGLHPETATPPPRASWTFEL